MKSKRKTRTKVLSWLLSLSLLLSLIPSMSMTALADDITFITDVPASEFSAANGDIAIGKATSSSAGISANGVDGTFDTRWESAQTDEEWFMLDLGNGAVEYNTVGFAWETAYASKYEIRTSSDGDTFTTAATVEATSPQSIQINLGKTYTDRYIWVQIIERGTNWGNSFYEMGVWNKTASDDETTEKVISWSENAQAGNLAATYGSEGFLLTCTDPDGHQSIDSHTAAFGTAENYKVFTHRLKTGSRSGVKNSLKLTVGEAGTLNVYVRTGSNSATDRTLVLKQGDTELYNQIVKESDAVEAEGLPSSLTKVYPVISVEVQAGDVEITYPVNGLNFYGFSLTKAAAGEPVIEYPLWVGGTQVTSANANDVFGDGKVSFTPATTGENPTPATLTLNGYSYTGEGYAFFDESTWQDNCASIYAAQDLKIEFSGTNNLSNNATDKTGHGIYVTDGDLTVSGGDGDKLTASSVGGEGSGIAAISGSVTITGGEVTATGKRFGITGNNGVTIDGGKVTATGTATLDNGYSTGINSYYGAIDINGGTVTATAEGDGISAFECNVNFKDCTVTATGKEYGVVGYDISFDGATVTALCEGGNSIGISASDVITFDICTVTASGTYLAILAMDHATYADGLAVKVGYNENDAQILDNPATWEFDGNWAKIEVPSAAYGDYVPTASDDETALAGKVVQFNGYDWYLIEDNSTAADAGSVTLLAKDAIGDKSVFNSSKDDGNAYSGSVVKGAVDALTAANGPFADVADAILTVDLTDVNVTGVKLYLLSAAEADALPQEVRYTGAYWWLRSPGNSSDKATCVYNQSGTVNFNGSYVTYADDIRPALQLDLSKVTFDSTSKEFMTSAAEDETSTIYFKVTQEWWKTDSVGPAAYYYNNEDEFVGWPGVAMEQVTGETDLWKCEVPAGMTYVIFTRLDASGNDGMAKTSDLTIPTDGKNLFTVTSESAVWGDPGVTGEWSVYSAADAVIEYPLWVGGVQVTNKNASNIDGNNKASYDAETNTLTLNGYTNSGTARADIQSGVNNAAIYYDDNMFSPNPLTIQLAEGTTNSLTMTGDRVYGIYVFGSALTITGNGTLNVQSEEMAINDAWGVAITGGTVYAASSGYYGINSVTIGSDISAVTVTGKLGAVYGGSNEEQALKNAVAGTGWTDEAGTTGKADLAISTTGQNVSSYKKVYFTTHTHDFTYSVSGATITATCSANGCPLPPSSEGGTDHVATLTIVAPTLTTYGGTGDAVATLTGLTDFNTVTGLNVQTSSIVYWNAKIQEGVYKTDGDQPLTAAPTSVGNYLAKITVNNCIASVGYTIAKAAPVAGNFTYAAPSDLTYDGTAKTATVTAKEGITGVGQVTVKYYSDAACTTEVDNPTDVGTYYVGITVAEGDNYNAVTSVLYDSNWKFTIGKATPTADNFDYNAPSSLGYDGTAKSATVIANSDATGMGQVTVKYYSDAACTTEVENPTAAGTYYVGITVTEGDNYNAVTSVIHGASWTFTITKANPTADAPTDLTATYGQTLANVSLEGKNPEGNTPGTWAWADAATTSVGSVGVRTFKANFTPTDTTNYNSKSNVDVTVTVGKATPTYTVPAGLTATYGDLLSSVALPTGWAWTNGAQSVGNAGNNTFTATFTPTDTDNYNTVENVNVTVTVGKADPSYTVPTGLAATYGDTLANVTLPTGWAWADSTQSVGNAGTKTFKANFTPTDTTNYNTVSNVDVSVTVNKADPSYTVPTGLTATYGDTIANVTLPTGWAWADSTQSVGNAGTKTFKANFTPTDTANYNTVENVDVTLTVNPASVTLTANSGNEIYDATEKTVEGFTASVEGLTFTGVTAGVSGTNAAEYAVTFTGVTVGETKDSTGNYVVTETTDGKLTIGKAPLAVTADNLSKRTGDTDPALTYKAEGFVGTDTAETVITGTLVRDEGDDVGTYPIKQGTLAANDNYEITFTEGTFTINRRSSGGGGGTTTYTVKFDTTGGSDVKNVSVKSGQTIGSIKEPQKKGFIFTGWYSNEELSDPYSADEKVTENTTLYAGWKVDPVREFILTIGEEEATVWNEARSNDVAPIIRNDRTMLPARFVTENLGATVDWIGEEQKVLITKDDLKIEIYIDSDKAYVNGEEVILDSPAFIENDRTYTPVRFIAETLGVTVDWDEATQQVIITKPVE